MQRPDLFASPPNGELLALGASARNRKEETECLIVRRRPRRPRAPRMWTWTSSIRPFEMTRGAHVYPIPGHPDPTTQTTRAQIARSTIMEL